MIERRVYLELELRAYHVITIGVNVVGLVIIVGVATFLVLLFVANVMFRYATLGSSSRGVGGGSGGGGSSGGGSGGSSGGDSGGGSGSSSGGSSGGGGGGSYGSHGVRVREHHQLGGGFHRRAFSS